MNLRAIAIELREGPPRRSGMSLGDWIGFGPRRGGMSLEAFKLVHDVAREHEIDKYRNPEDAISYAIEAAEADGERIEP